MPSTCAHSSDFTKLCRSSNCATIPKAPSLHDSSHSLSAHECSFSPPHIDCIWLGIWNPGALFPLRTTHHPNLSTSPLSFALNALLHTSRASSTVTSCCSSSHTATHDTPSYNYSHYSNTLYTTTTYART